jgi:hypothetical protein
LPAAAQDVRDLCPDRPGANDSPCIVDVGRVQIETGISWSRSGEGAGREETLLLGDTLLRAGISSRTELRLAFTAYGRVDPRGGPADEGFGDVTLGLRHNLVSPDGSGGSIAAQGFVTLPTGSGPFDSGEWSAGLALPMSFELTPQLSFAATPRLEAVADADGDGRHLAAGTSIGLGLSLAEPLSLSADLNLMQDDDPSGSSTDVTAGLALAWQVAADAQLDLGARAGLNEDSEDLELYAGLVLRF